MLLYPEANLLAHADDILPTRGNSELFSPALQAIDYREFWHWGNLEESAITAREIQRN